MMTVCFFTVSHKGSISILVSAGFHFIPQKQREMLSIFNRKNHFNVLFDKILLA